uniref:Uncharacterized protein n=1 Tax=Oryza brachyantha TaxID=4533 RepID=J3LD62_ORYBR
EACERRKTYLICLLPIDFRDTYLILVVAVKKQKNLKLDQFRNFTNYEVLETCKHPNLCPISVEK